MVMEATAFKPEWGQVIFQTANEIAQNTKIRQRAVEVAAKAASERAWWDEKRNRAEKELLAESASDEDTVLVEQPQGVKATAAGKKSKAKN